MFPRLPILKVRRSARGVTLLETILAAALLAGVAGAIVNALAGMASSEDKRRLRLAGYEVANRLLLQYSDDANKMPEPDAPYEYQPGVFFRYTLTKLPLKLELPPDSVMKPTGWGPSDFTLKQLVLLDVKVFVSNERGDFIQPIAQLTRCYHPWPLYSSNPDARRRWFLDQGNLATLTSAMMESISGKGSGTGTGSGSGGSGSGSGSGRGGSGTPGGTRNPRGGAVAPAQSSSGGG